MAIVTKSIGTAGGRDYSTINAWDAAIPANLVTAGDSWVGECYNDSQFGSSVLAAHTTDATHTIKLTAAAGQSFQDHASVRTNALRYNQSLGVGLRGTGTYSSTLNINGTIDYLTISRLQIYHTSANGTCHVVLFNASNANNCLLKDCIIEQADDSNVVQNIQGSSLAINCAIIVDNSTSGVVAVKTFTGGTITHCTIARASNRTAGGTGITQSHGTALVKSCAIFGYTTPVNASASSSSTKCGTEQSSGIPGTSHQFSISYSASSPFSNATTASSAHDFKTVSGTTLDGNGLLDSTNAPNDITGFARPAAPTIGAWQLPTGGPFPMFIRRDGGFRFMGGGLC